MLIYVTDTNKECELNLYQPNGDVEITEEFIGLFLANGIEFLTEREKAKYNTKARYKTSREIARYWGSLIAQMQDLFDKYADRNIVDKIVLEDVRVRDIFPE